MKRLLLAMFCVVAATGLKAQIQTNAGIQYLQCMSKDVSTDFYDLSNTYFLADSLDGFNTKRGMGFVQWKRYRLSPRQAFNLNGYWPVRMQMLDFPDAAYENDPILMMKIEFLTPRTARIRMETSPAFKRIEDLQDVMFCDAFKEKLPALRDIEGGLKTTADDAKIAFQTKYGCIEIQRYPFRIVLKDAKGKVLTQTRHIIGQLSDCNS